MKNFNACRQKKYFLTVLFSTTVFFNAQSQTCDYPLIDMSGASTLGTGTVASCTQVGLQQLIDKGGKIKFNCGAAPFMLKLTSSLIIPIKEVILDGEDKVTISGNKAVRIFQKNPAANQNQGTLFGLQNIDLIDGRAPQNTKELGGAAIQGQAFGSLKLVNVDFTGNEGPLSGPDGCGAVHTILFKEVIIQNCVFKNNKAANGAAVGCIGSATTISNCIFENNEATGVGGTPPGVGGNGGAVYMDGVDQNGVNNYARICNTKFIGNKAGYQAGAVNIIFYSGKGSVSNVDQCLFENNSCAVAQGGAYYHMNGPLNVTNSTFFKNSSPSQGGALWTSNTKLSVTNTTLVDNKALSANGKGGLGGAICIDGSGTEKSATINSCTFSGSQAGDFASSIFTGVPLSLSNSIFYNEKIGKNFQGNPYGGGAINKDVTFSTAGNNLQFPSTYSAQYGTENDNWIASAVSKGGTVTITDPLLLALANNGGFAQTMAIPSASSPAVDKGNNCSLTDQRGAARVGKCDLGAYEFNGTITGTLDENTLLSKIVLYPNPARENVGFSIKNLHTYPASIDVYNMSGQWLMQTTAQNEGEVFTLQGLRGGMYFIRVSTENSINHSTLLLQ